MSVITSRAVIQGPVRPVAVSLVSLDTELLGPLRPSSQLPRTKSRRDYSLIVLSLRGLVSIYINIYRCHNIYKYKYIYLLIYIYINIVYIYSVPVTAWYWTQIATASLLSLGWVVGCDN